MINLFYECEDSNVAGYADDTTPYPCATDIPSAALELQVSATKLLRWFKNKHLNANPGKSHILLSSKSLILFQLMNFSCCKFPREIARNYNKFRIKV